ncbi:MAG: hypothetical protein ABIU97_00285 [Dehalococcoidia bacterium]
MCIQFGLAGFTNSASGLWTFVDVHDGDFVSFLYGARVFNLYEVVRKTAYLNADQLPPWPPVTFQPSGLTYYFPFRAALRHVREFNEPLVRSEFAYVGENLLLRGGYRKTHFQADQTTLQAVSEMGVLSQANGKTLDVRGAKAFAPRFTTDKSKVQTPQTFLFRELFLQAIVRSHLSVGSNLKVLLTGTGLAEVDPNTLEVLSEKAFPEGHVDLLIKEAAPKGVSKKVVIEVKRRAAVKGDILQLLKYRATLGQECAGAVLISSGASSKVRDLASAEEVTLRDYALDFPSDPVSFDELLDRFRIV